MRGGIAQLVEHMTENHGVPGSIPGPATGDFCISIWRGGLLRVWLVLVLIVLSSLAAACGPEEEGGVTDAGEPQPRTVEVTREVTVEKTVIVEKESEEGGATRERLPGPALPGEVDVQRRVGETATLDNGDTVTVFSVQTGVSPQESMYEAREGREFFVIEAEVCVPETANEPAYFTPREFSLRVSETVRRMASVPTKLPALRGSSVDPGACNRGFITFQIDDGESPQDVVYEGSSSVEWNIEEG